MALVGSKYMDSPDLGKSVLGWFPQHHMVTVIPSSALHIQDLAFKHLAADVTQFIDAPGLAW